MIIKSEFQSESMQWYSECFGDRISDFKIERTHRFIEESLELAQAVGCSKRDVLKIVDYVYARDRGGLNEEAGGSLLTLSLLCSALGIDMEDAGWKELDKVWKLIAKIRRKRMNQDADSPRP